MTQDLPSVASNWIQIGGRVVDLDNGVIEYDGRSHRITHQAGRVLKALIDAAPEVCTREALIDTVWSGNFRVADRAIPSVIYALRRALQDHSQPRLIRTVPRVGYGLVAVQPAPRPGSRDRVRWWTLGVALTMAGVLLFHAFGPEIRIRIHKSVAVQPESAVVEDSEAAG